MKPPFQSLRAQLPSNTEMMRLLGFNPDPWQIEVLESPHKRLLLNCSRQAGKSTVVAVLGIVEAMFNPLHKVVIISRSLRQSRELFGVCRLFHRMLKERLKQRTTQQEIELDNMSRIMCLPCKEETIRGIAHVNLLIIDEAARVPDDLYKAVRPMLAVSGGRMICLSTPYGKRGFFYEAWSQGGDDWQRISIPASQVSRITPEFLAEERRALGESWYRQEYECAFEALEGLVFPGLAGCVVDELPAGVRELAARLEGRGASCRREALGEEWREEKWRAAYWMKLGYEEDEAHDRAEDWSREKMAEWNKDRTESGDAHRKMPPWIAARCGVDLATARDGPSPPAPLPRGARGEDGRPSPPGLHCGGARGELVGGMDFGFRNPFAAVWGVLDAEGVLWLVGEHYQRQRPLSHHLRFLPRGVTWYADPAGANEIAELRRAGFTVRRGINTLRPGIGAVAARIENGGLKVLAGACPQLLAEAELYHYGDEAGDREAERPVDESNHALAALRYLVSRLAGRHFDEQQAA